MILQTYTDHRAALGAVRHVGGPQEATPEWLQLEDQPAVNALGCCMRFSCSKVSGAGWSTLYL